MNQNTCDFLFQLFSHWTKLWFEHSDGPSALTSAAINEAHFAKMWRQWSLIFRGGNSCENIVNEYVRMHGYIQRWLYIHTPRSGEMFSHQLSDRGVLVTGSYRKSARKREGRLLVWSLARVGGTCPRNNHSSNREPRRRWLRQRRRFLMRVPYRLKRCVSYVEHRRTAVYYYRLIDNWACGLSIGCKRFTTTFNNGRKEGRTTRNRSCEEICSKQIGHPSTPERIAHCRLNKLLFYPSICV